MTVSRFSAGVAAATALLVVGAVSVQAQTNVNGVRVTTPQTLRATTDDTKNAIRHADRARNDARLQAGKVAEQRDKRDRDRDAR